MIHSVTYKKNFVRLSIAVLFWLMFISFLHTQSANALVTLKPAPPAGSIPGTSADPASILGLLTHCDSGNTTPKLVQWISPAGNAAAIDMTRPFGTKSLPLRFHYAGAVCFQAPSPLANQVNAYQLRIYGVTVLATNPTSAFVDPSFSTQPAQPALSFNPYNVKGTYNRDANPASAQFSLQTNDPDGFATGTYEIIIKYRGINTRVPLKPDHWDCTVPPNYKGPTGLTYADAGSVGGFNNCPDVTTRVRINFTVDPNTAPNIKVSSPVCKADGTSPKAFTITSTDADSPNPNASYRVTYQLQSFGAGGWVNAGAAVTTVKQFGTTAIPRNYAMNPNASVSHRILVRATDGGYGVPRKSTPTDPVYSASWPVCTKGPVADRAPATKIFPTCNLPGNRGPGFSIQSNDFDGKNYTVNWYVRSVSDVLPNLAGAPPLAPMPGPWGALASLPNSHTYRMSTMKGYNPAKYYQIHASTRGVAPPKTTLGPSIPAERQTLGPCAVPRDFKINAVVNKPRLLPDDQYPKGASFSVTITAVKAPVKNIPNTRTFYIKRLDPVTHLLKNINFAVHKTTSIPSTTFSITNGINTSTDCTKLPSIVIVNDNPKSVCDTINIPIFPTVIQPGDQVCELYTSPSGGTVNPDGSIDWLSNTDQNNCVDVTTSTYFSVFGGDVSVGARNAGLGNCAGWTDNITAGIYSFKGRVSGLADNKLGATAEAGVFAQGPIDNGDGASNYGFSSARFRSSYPAVANGLIFANSTPPNNPAPPGNSGMQHCPYDFMGNIPHGTPGASGVPNINLNSQVNAKPENSYSVQTTAALTRISAPGGVQPGKKINVYVTGDVFIGDNIAYSNPDGWSGLGDIPRVQIVAKGNIYIDPRVKTLDGIYVAQGGTIYTCSEDPPIQGPALTPPAISPLILYNQCNNQLTVNGSFIASRIKWLRTFGSLNNGTVTERPTDWPPATWPFCQSAGTPVQSPTCASEVINFTPESYLVAPVPSSNVDTTFDSVISLPPLL